MEFLRSTPAFAGFPTGTVPIKTEGDDLANERNATRNIVTSIMATH
jgi:hypothetical protein